jgi:hypothetical protein
MDLDHLKRISGVTQSPQKLQVLRKDYSSQYTYLRSKFPDLTEEQIGMMRTKLILMDTKSLIGVDILEEQPDNLNEVLIQYKIWDNLHG